MKIKIGKVEKRLNQIIEEEGAVYLTLLDPEEENIEEIAENVKDYADAIMVGGSIGIVNLDETVKKIKKITKLPIILFPGNVDGLSRYADAVFYMSLMNSANTYWVVTAPTLGAITILKYNLEPIPMAYLCIEPAKKQPLVMLGRLERYLKTNQK